jgi:type I restriction enzyme S subunit
MTTNKHEVAGGGEILFCHPEHSEGSPERGAAGGGEILRCTQDDGVVRDDGVGVVEHPPFEIPPSWVWTRLGEAFNLVGGSTPSTSQARFYSENAIKWLTPADLSKLDDVYIYSGKKDITEAGLKSCSSQVIPKNSIIYSTRAPIGHIAIAGVDLCTNQGFKNIVIENPILSKYTFYYLKHMTPYIQSKGSGTTFLEVSMTVMKQVPYCLPPLAEQKRIVAKVDACFAKLDATDAQLAHAERLVGQCRKSILNQAVRGQLLPQDANDEPAIELLKRIQAEKPVSKKTRHPEHREGSPERGVAGGGEILRCTQDDGVGGVEHPRLRYRLRGCGLAWGRLLMLEMEHMTHPSIQILVFR